MIDLPPQAARKIRKLTEILGEEMPELMGVLDKIKKGNLSEEEGMGVLGEILKEDPQLVLRFSEVLAKHHGALSGEDVGGAVFDSGVGLPQINPLVEAALAERLQFDGDIPQARTGPLPLGAAAAVPVATDAVNPVMIGKMLADASATVTDTVRQHDQRRRKVLEKIASMEEQALMQRSATKMVVSDPRVDHLVWGSAETDPAIYRRGTLPAPVPVEEPSGGALLRMTEEERKTHAWKFLSTSQGRRSAANVILDLIHKELVLRGLNVAKRPYDPAREGTPLAVHKWTVSLNGRGGMQPAFNFIEIASKALTLQLVQQVDKVDPDRLLFLEVIPVDTVEVRQVGWGARLMGGLE